MNDYPQTVLELRDHVTQMICSQSPVANRIGYEIDD